MNDTQFTQDKQEVFYDDDLMHCVEQIPVHQTTQKSPEAKQPYIDSSKSDA